MKKTVFIFMSVLFMTGCGSSSDDDTFEDIDSFYEESFEDTDSFYEGSYGESEVDDKQPPKGEYDEIILEDGRYYLCKKTESGFDVNSECYGIYDGENGAWALEYREMPIDDIPNPTYHSHGEGVFSYNYNAYYGTDIFLSADLGDIFSTPNVHNREQVRFVDGKALVWVSNEEYGYMTAADGSTRIVPNEELCWLSTYGEFEDVIISGFENDNAFYWDSSHITGSDEEDIFATSFHNYVTGEKVKYLYIYYYEDGTYTIIDDQNYCTRLTVYVGDAEDNSDVTLEGDLIRVTNLSGDDGNLYYAEFDKSGNLVTEATLMY